MQGAPGSAMRGIGLDGGTRQMGRYGPPEAGFPGLPSTIATRSWTPGPPRSSQ